MRLFAEWVIVVVATLRGYGEREVIVLLAQSALETGNWTNDTSKSLWYSDKNLFGMSEMRNAKRRERLRGVRLGPDGLYRAQFKSLWASVQDRLDWDEQMGVSKGENYLVNVSKKYHKSDNYARQVGTRINDNFHTVYWLSLATIPVMLILILKWLRIF